MGLCAVVPSCRRRGLVWWLFHTALNGCIGGVGELSLYTFRSIFHTISYVSSGIVRQMDSYTQIVKYIRNYIHKDIHPMGVYVFVYAYAYVCLLGQVLFMLMLMCTYA